MKINSINEIDENNYNEQDNFDVYLNQRLLKDKVQKQYHQIKRKFFQISNGYSDGKISRQALHHLIASIFGVQQQIKPKEIDQILQSLHLKHFEKIRSRLFFSKEIHNENKINNLVLMNLFIVYLLNNKKILIHQEMFYLKINLMKIDQDQIHRKKIFLNQIQEKCFLS